MLRVGMVLGLGVLLSAAVVHAQGVTTPGGYVTEAQITATAMKGKAMTDATHPVGNVQVLKVAPYTVLVEYHAAVGLASVHEQDAELIYVFDGSGTIITGGTMHGATRTNAENLNAPSIDGGVTRHVTKGDWILVDRAEPHFWSQLDGPMIAVTIHLPLKPSK